MVDSTGYTGNGAGGACGPNEFVDAMLAVARAASLPPENVRREKWG